MNPSAMYPPPQTNPVLHAPTTPCEFDMWMHTYEPRSDVPPPQAKPVQQNPTTPCLLHMSMSAYVTTSYVPTPANQTQCFRALLHHIHLTCESMGRYPNDMCAP